MALGFGRKKAAGDAPASPVSVPVEAAPVAAHAPASPSPSAPIGDDLEAFDLDAFVEPPLAELPATGAPAVPGALTTADSAFDFPAVPATQVSAASAAPPGATGADSPDFDKLYEIEQANAARTVRAAPPAPFVPPSVTVQEPAAPFYEPQVPAPEMVVAPRKKFPLLPLLGALAILGAGGGLAYKMSQGTPDTEDTAPVVTRTRPRPASGGPVPVAADASASTAVVQKAPVLAKQAAPLEVVPVKPIPAQKAPVAKIVTTTNASPVRPGIAPATDQRTQLKALWKRGADAKHRGDEAGARRYWTQGLKLQPGNAGFKQSIAKLPK